VKVARWDYVDRPACLKGTRIEELEKLMNWMEDEGERRMYVLTGLAGIGKTTIAKSAAEIAHGKHILGASFFCSRDSDERSNMRLIFPTIAFQLSHYNNDFRAEVLNTIKKDPDIGYSTFDKQLEELIVRPMQRVVASIVTSIKLKLGFARSLSDQQIQVLIVEPLRSLINSIETDPGFTKPLPNVDQRVLTPLKSVLTSLKENNLPKTVVAETISIIESIEKNLPINRAQEVIIDPIQNVLLSMEQHHSNVFSTSTGKAAQSISGELSALAKSAKDFKAITAFVEEQLVEQIRRSIINPTEKIITSVKEQLLKGHILPDDVFRDQVIDPVWNIVSRQKEFHSVSNDAFVGRMEESWRSTVPSLQERLDISPWLPDALLDRFIATPLRTIAKTKTTSPIPDLLETRLRVVKDLQAVISLMETSQRNGRSLSDDEYEAAITELIQTIKPFARPAVVVVDALDECKDLETPEKFLLALAQHIHSVPCLKVLATSRPEFSTRLALQDSSVDHLTDVLILHEVDPVRVAGDIRLFFCDRLAMIATRRRRDNSMLPNGWPPDALVDKLVEKAAGFFIFAFTICRYLESPGNLEKQLESIADLDTNVTEGRLGIDKIYQMIIDAALSNFVDDETVSQCGLVVAAIILLFDPLSLVDLAGVLGMNPDCIRGVLRDLHSVLVIPSNGDGIIHTFHASFHDFLTDRKRYSGKIYVEPAQRHMEITILLLKRMMERLKKNICQLDEFQLNKEVQDLYKRRAKFIGGPLAYACRHWAQHLSRVSPIAGGAAILKGMLESLLETKLLNWIEVLSLLGEVKLVDVSLTRVRQWFSVCPHAGY
jgi:hypothetical protein